jgi:DNA-binding response OmpR family regulator
LPQASPPKKKANRNTALTGNSRLREVRGPSYVDQSHYLHIYMTQLRHKLEPDPARPRFLLTETGVGYRLAGEGACRRASGRCDPVAAA